MRLGKLNHDERQRILHRTLLDGPMWETPSVALIDKVSAKKFKQKLIGAKAAKAAERFESQGEVLCPSEATTFRASAARANYPSLDRPERVRIRNKKNSAGSLPLQPKLGWSN